MEGFPDILKSDNGLHVFVWGHEVDLHDAGRRGGDGSADLITTDEKGMVWLIEAKFSQTSERGDFVWGNQLLRYKQAIQCMEWQDILAYAKNFLRWNEKIKPCFEIPSSVETFTHVLEMWQARIGRAQCDPNTLNSKIASHLKSGTYGVMVLTDT
jgi:hypothetical protein